MYTRADRLHEDKVNYLISNLYYSQSGQNQLNELNAIIKNYSYLRNQAMHLDQLLRFILFDWVDQNIVQVENNESFAKLLADDLIAENFLPAIIKKLEMLINPNNLQQNPLDAVKEYITLIHRASSLGYANASFALYALCSGLDSRIIIQNHLDSVAKEYTAIKKKYGDTAKALNFPQLSDEQGSLRAGMTLACMSMRDQQYRDSRLSRAETEILHDFKDIPIDVQKGVAYLKNALEKSELQISFKKENGEEKEFLKDKASCAFELGLRYEENTELGEVQFRTEQMLHYYELAAKLESEGNATLRLLSFYLEGSEKMQLKSDIHKAEDLLSRNQPGFNCAAIDNICNPDKQIIGDIVRLYLFYYFIYLSDDYSQNYIQSYDSSLDSIGRLTLGNILKSLFRLIGGKTNWKLSGSNWSSELNAVKGLLRSWEQLIYEEKNNIIILNRIMKETYEYFSLDCPFVIPTDSENVLYAVKEKEQGNNFKKTSANEAKFDVCALEAVGLAGTKMRPYKVLSISALAKIGDLMLEEIFKKNSQADHFLYEATHLAETMVNHTVIEDHSVVATYLNCLFLAFKNDCEQAAGQITYLLRTGQPGLAPIGSAVPTLGQPEHDLASKWDDVHFIFNQEKYFADVVEKKGKDKLQKLIAEIYDHFKVKCPFFENDPIFFEKIIRLKPVEFDGNLWPLLNAEQALFEKKLMEFYAKSTRPIHRVLYTASKVTDMYNQELLREYLNDLFSAIQSADQEIACEHLIYLLKHGSPYFPDNPEQCCQTMKINDNLATRATQLKLFCLQTGDFENAFNKFDKKEYQHLVVQVYRHFGLSSPSIQLVQETKKSLDTNNQLATREFKTKYRSDLWKERKRRIKDREEMKRPNKSDDAHLAISKTLK